MVFLTALLAGRSRGPHPFWRRQFTKRLTWHFYGRKRNCYKLSQAPLRRALRFATFDRKYKWQATENLNEIRIAAGCAEHGLQYSSFMHSLKESNVILTKKVLSELAIYEPRTFQSLCELAKRQHSELFKNNLNPSRRIFTKGML